MSSKPTIEFIRSEFAKEGYRLLTTEYKNNTQKLDYVCPRSHRHFIDWKHWSRKQRCPICSKEKESNEKRTLLKFIKTSFVKEKYKLLTKRYINSSQKLEYICPKGHRHNISWNSWQQGQRCPYCAEDAKLTTEFVMAEFAKRKCKLLTREYINNKQKLDYMCPRGYKHSTTWRKWRLRKYVCDCEDNHNKVFLSYIKESFKKDGYTLLTKEYKDNKQKLEYICSRGHKHSIKWNDWQQGNRCPYCTNIISKGEIQVKEFIKSLGVKVSPNNRNQIFNPETGYGLELDIFMPTFNKAVEYNGEYWHQDKDKDLLKQQLCKEKDINLLTIWDKEWKTDKNVCEDKIKEFLSDI